MMKPAASVHDETFGFYLRLLWWFGFLFCYTYILGKQDIWFLRGWLDFTCAKVAKVERIEPVMERTYIIHSVLLIQ